MMEGIQIKGIKTEINSLFGNKQDVSSARSRGLFGYVCLSMLFVQLGVIVPLLCFTSAFQITTSLDWLLLGSFFGSIIFWGLLFAVQFYPKVLLISLTVVLLAIGYAGYLLRKYLLHGYYYIFNQITEHINHYFDLSLEQYAIEYDEMFCVTLLLLYISVFLSIALSIHLLYRVLGFFYFVPALFLIFSGFAVGRVPEGVLFLLSIIFLFTNLSLRRISHYKRKTEEGQIIWLHSHELISLKQAAVMGILIGFLSLIIVFAFPQEKYDQQNKIDQYKKVLQEKIYNFSMEETINQLRYDLFQLQPLFDRTPAKNKAYLQGGLSGGTLRSGGEVSFSNLVAIKASVPAYSSGMYLKGFAGGHYIGSSWKGLSKKAASNYNEIKKKYEANGYTGENLSTVFIQLLEDYNAKKTNFRYADQLSSIMTKQADIELVQANNSYYYAPYYEVDSTVNPEGLETKDDLYIGQKNAVNQYSFIYYSIGQNNDLRQQLELFRELSGAVEEISIAYPEYAAFETDYRKFVYQNYVGIEKGRFPRIEQLQLGVSAAFNIESTLHVIDRVQHFLSAQTSYSLNPGELPRGKDFIEYFLFDSKLGYCAHYASAAAILLRYYGVPARYVEGYIVTNNDIYAGTVEAGTNRVNVEIRDTNAHAWVEVYFDGIGWLPVEMTAGYAENGISRLNSSIQERVESLQETETVTPTTQPTQAAAQSTPIVTKKPIDTLTIQLPKIGKISMTYFMCFVLFLLVLFFCVRYLFIRIRRKSIINQNNCSIAVIYIYHCMEQIFEILGYKKMNQETIEEYFRRVKQGYFSLPSRQAEMYDIVMRAKFSEDTIKEEERNHVKDYYSMLRNVFYHDMLWYKKLYLRYWKGI